jgi:phosphatidylglycerol:prolipoprotein diacylglycerol transferase
MNGEAFGYETDWFCRMGLNNILTGYEWMEVHPTFLYESLWNLLGVLGVFLFDKYIHKKYDGQLFLMIFAWYGFGRTFIEGLRTDSLYIGPEEWGLRVSQILGAVIFLICAGFLIYFMFKKPTKPFYFKEAKVEETSKVNGKNEKTSITRLFKAIMKNDAKSNDKNSKKDGKKK